MKVGIIGNYGHNNNGDEAILAGLIHQLITVSKVEKENIVVFSNNPSNTKERHGVSSYPLLYKEATVLKSGWKTIRESRKIMKHLDVLVVGGGGLLMDMYKRDAPLYSVLGLTGKFSGCRVAVHGVGAGPITTKTGTFFIKQLIRASSSVAVRDEKSKKLLQSIGVQKDINVIYDPAFSVPVQQPHQRSEQIRNVGVTAVPYFSNYYWPEPNPAKYEAYLQGMAQSLDELIETHNVNVTFFSTKYPEDVQVTKDIAASMKYHERLNILEENLTPEDIIEVAAAQDLVIGTRLHSLILSVNAQTPVIGIEYHQKVKDFMSEINKESYSVAIDNVTDIPAVFEKAVEDWGNLQEETESVSDSLKQSAAEGMNLLLAERTILG
ncbi:polysaccharide pyruvyl transferase [Salibacterium salarium]|uniref:Polysaccharide pyruvyl transferase n=1 Tax=Salibacterium salarium TaxID=284579 RepID=A0A428N9U1_9BACI|nr:polysaccharide pyruvyl transferase family protein [Salibacterium salarium]RSL35148.1 polysaccharide pyruvyl transferase [Salibacterium salarium]